MYLLSDMPVELGRRVTRSDFMPYGQCNWLCYCLIDLSVGWFVSVNRISKKVTNLREMFRKDTPPEQETIN